MIARPAQPQQRPILARVFEVDGLRGVDRHVACVCVWVGGCVWEGGGGWVGVICRERDREQERESERARERESERERGGAREQE